MNKYDLINKRFGRLKVLKFYGKSNKGLSLWNCICDCGNKKVVKRDYLVGQSTRSCGCYSKDAKQSRRIDLTKQKFGRLTVLSYFKRSSSRETLWKCLCECGKEIITSSDRLRRKATKSCGCYALEQKRRGHSWKGYKDLSATFYGSIRASAKIRDITFEVSMEDLWKLFIKQNQICALSGIPISFSKDSKLVHGTASLDRKDSSKGYIKDNIQWVHKNINLMKNRLNENDFINMCECVTKYKVSK